MNRYEVQVVRADGTHLVYTATAAEQLASVATYAMARCGLPIGDAAQLAAILTGNALRDGSAAGLFATGRIYIARIG